MGMHRVVVVILLVIFAGNPILGIPVKNKIDPPEKRYFLSFLATSDKETGGEFNANSIDQNYEILLKYFAKRKDKIKDKEILASIIFNKVSEAFLHKYKQYASYSELFTNYTFDCATATALYASYLSDLDIYFEIWETNYHTFIKIPNGSEVILLETTDPVDGFKTGEEAILLEQEYIKDNEEGCLYDHGLNIHRKTSTDEFIGLLFYNQAVKSYNEANYLKAMSQISRAETYYSTDRIIMLKDLIMDRVLLITTSSL